MELRQHKLSLLQRLTDLVHILIPVVTVSPETVSAWMYEIWEDSASGKEDWILR